MGRKGQRTTQKRISADIPARIKRKEATWTFKTMPGPHKGNESIPLGIILRDFLKDAETAKEAKYLVNQGYVAVDGKVRKKLRFPVGFGDVVVVGKKYYRLVSDKKGRLVPKEISAQESRHKLCKVLGKSAVGNKMVAFSTNDGRTIIDSNKKISPGDTVKISLPKQKIVEHIPLTKGNTVLVTGGKRAGSIATVAGIVQGTISRKRLVDLKVQNQEGFQTVDTNVFVVGTHKPLVGVTLNE